MAASSRTRAAVAWTPPQIKNGGFDLLVTLEGMKSLVSECGAEKVQRLVEEVRGTATGKRARTPLHPRPHPAILNA